MNHKTSQQLIQIVLNSFEAERTNNVSFGKSLISDDFLLRSMIIHGDKLFPVLAGGEVPLNLEEAYTVQGREFYVWNAAANEDTQTVFIELAEVEPRDGVKRVWPYVLVCQIEDGKIKRSRHYGDPAILEKNLKITDVQDAVES